MANDTYFPSSTVLCFENFKEASLYFDHVLPLSMGRMRGDSELGDVLVGYPEEVPSAVLSHLIDGVEGNTVSFSHANRVMSLVAGQWVEFARNVEPYVALWTAGNSREAENDEYLRKQYQRLQQAYFSDASIPGKMSIREAFRSYATDVGFGKFCVAIPPTASVVGAQRDPSITLSRLHLVDAAQAEWRQLVELRKDVLTCPFPAYQSKVEVRVEDYSMDFGVDGN